MKHKCGIIKDLLPLYVDSVCSDESREAVDEHISECAECRALMDELRKDDVFDEPVLLTPDESQQIDALKSANKKWKKTKKIFVAAGIGIGAVIVLFFTVIYALVGFVVAQGILTRPEVFTDPAEYSWCLDEEEDGQYLIGEKYGTNGGIRGLFPEKTGENTEVLDFSYMHYNPFDPQIIAYITLKYSDEDYRNELERLSELGIEEYYGVYSVTDAPDNYRFAAVRADEYGFVYAMTPVTENNTVTYACIRFCNNFLDVNVRKYIPAEYLPENFDAGEFNPYKRQLGKQRD